MADSDEAEEGECCCFEADMLGCAVSLPPDLSTRRDEVEWIDRVKLRRSIEK